jgi:D-alanyl-D-alanine carboxypeptidase (penicillin-binding protein 5/6)
VRIPSAGPVRSVLERLRTGIARELPEAGVLTKLRDTLDRARREDLSRISARIQREVRLLRRPGHGFWGSRLSLVLGLTLAALGTLSSATWALATGKPVRWLDGTLIVGEAQGADVAKPVLTASGGFVFPGGAPRLDWPTSGRAAVEVEGMGLIGHDGGMTAQTAIASIAKTMTAYVVLKDHPLGAHDDGPTITVTSATAGLYPQAIARDESAVPLRAGEKLTERQALEAMMLASAGDMADLLAVWDRGSVAKFAAAMNAQAHALGMTDTVYTDPTGLAASTVSTMADQLKLAEAVQHVPALTAVVAETSAQIPVAGRVKNINFDLGSYGIDGIKTGTTAAAGSCLLFSAHITVGGRKLTLLGVVLGMPGSTGTPWSALKAAESLVHSAEASVRTTTVAAPGVAVAALEQDGTRFGRLGVAAPLTVVGWPGLGFRLSVTGDAASPRLLITRTGGSADPVGVPLTTLNVHTTPSGKPATPAKSATPATQ